VQISGFLGFINIFIIFIVHFNEKIKCFWCLKGKKRAFLDQNLTTPVSYGILKLNIVMALNQSSSFKPTYFPKKSAEIFSLAQGQNRQKGRF
jgi:hypothetical protein